MLLRITRSFQPYKDIIESAVNANRQTHHGFDASLVCFDCSPACFFFIILWSSASIKHCVKGSHPFSYPLQFNHSSYLSVQYTQTEYGLLLYRIDRLEKHPSFISIKKNKSELSLSITVWFISSFSQLADDWLHQRGLSPTFLLFFWFKSWEFPSSCYTPEINQLQYLYQA